MKPSEISAIIKSGLKITKSNARPVPYVAGSGDPEAMPTVLLEKSDNKIVQDFQRTCDDAYLLSTITKRHPSQFVSNAGKAIAKRLTHFVTGGNTELAKAMGIASTGYGEEWVPTVLSGEITRMIELARRAVALIPRFNMPTNPFNWAGQSSRSTVYRGTSGTAPSDSKMGTYKVQFDASELVGYMILLDDLEEDAIVAMLPDMKRDLADGHARAEENLLLNGDKIVGGGGGEIDADNITATDQRRVAAGVRKYCIANSYTTDIAAMTSDVISGMIASLGVMGVIRADLMYVGSVSVGVKLCNLKDSSGNRVVLTQNELGQNNTFERGQLYQMFGIPYFDSEFMREDLNGSGVYDATTHTKTGLLLIHRPSWKIGDRRGITIETQRQATKRQTDIVSSQRLDIKYMRPVAATSIQAWYGINVTT